MSSSIVPLHVHSFYSLMAGIPSLPALCLAAKHQGASALALTDTNGLYGLIRFVQFIHLKNFSVNHVWLTVIANLLFGTLGADRWRFSETM